MGVAGASEGHPALFFAEFHIADIGAEPRADADADRDQHHVAAAQIARVEAADEIGGAFARRIAFVEILAVEQIVDQHEGVARVGARVEADRGAGPVDGAFALDLVVQRARSVAQPDAKRAAGFAADDIGVGFALLLQNIFDEAGEALRTLAEDAFGSADQIVFLVGCGVVGGRRPGCRRSGGRARIGRGDRILFGARGKVAVERRVARRRGRRGEAAGAPDC